MVNPLLAMRRKKTHKKTATETGNPPFRQEAVDSAEKQGSSRKLDLPSDRIRACLPISNRVRRGTWVTALLCLTLFFLILKSYSLQPFAGDEFIYLFQGKLVSEGLVPYADFAMAHPPVQALTTAAVFKIFGIHFTLMRLLPILWCLSGGIALSLLVRRELGGIASIVAATLYLTAHEPLRASSHFTGVNMTVALLLFTVLAYRTGWIRLAAALATSAVFTRLYAVPGVAALVLFALMADRKQGMRLIAYGAGMGTVAILIVGIWTGFGEMAHNIFAYHADKTPMSEKSLAGMRDAVLFHNATLATLFALSLPALLTGIAAQFDRTDGKSGTIARFRSAVAQGRMALPLLGALTAVVFLTLLLNLNRVWMYYYIPAFPFAAIPAAWMISNIFNGAVRLGLAKGRPSHAGLSVSRIVGGVFIVALFAISYYLSPRLEARLSYYNKSGDDASDESTHRYTFQPAPLPDGINNWVRTFLWHDERVIGDVYNTFNYYLWHESRVFDIVDKVVDIIKENTSGGAKIFGDSGTVPLFALLSERDIAGHEVDTNIQRYRSGNADPKELISKIDNHQTEMIILRRRFGVYGVPEVRKLVETKYRKLTEIRSAQGWVFQIFKRKQDLSDLKEK